MGTLQHLIVVIGFHDVNPIGEADDRIPWGKSGTALVIAVRILENSSRTSFSKPGRPVSLAARSFNVAS